MAKKLMTPLAAAVGAAFVASVTLTPVVNAAENPFAAQPLTSGYNLASSHAEGKCGEGMAKKAAEEGRCGEGMAKKAHEEGKCGEGKCGEGMAKKAHEEGKCGEGMAKKAHEEGKCGEGKCGEGMTKKAAEEGKCGEGKCGEGMVKKAAKEGACGAVLQGAGLGLRRSLLGDLESITTDDVQFMEVAPENWIHVGGRLGKQFRQYTERFPFLCHGLSLSIGSTDALDMSLLANIKKFMKIHNISRYSEHLSYCSDGGHLYDLMPIPFTQEAIKHVAVRVGVVQDFLGERIALENSSYYCAPQQEMSEIEFINGVIAEADCDLLLDVNNIYVNSINHRYDPFQFLQQLPLEKIAYVHVAGHYEEAEDLRVDTHGADVIDPVWELLQTAYEHAGVIPTLLERDFNIPPVDQLLLEVETIRRIQAQAESLKDGSMVNSGANALAAHSV